jgi:hypothetical protein
MIPETVNTPAHQDDMLIRLSVELLEGFQRLHLILRIPTLNNFKVNKKKELCMCPLFRNSVFSNDQAGNSQSGDKQRESATRITPIFSCHQWFTNFSYSNNYILHSKTDLNNL